ncbi:hypothetical protein ASPSYDRAFT_299801 [Aspergillus sydowii CBS 593.65]|uniref:Uncharacterized protein n=1 Tax=Aspergillus sydowii CBS 593.65 TaxID=1036612 RepID=A0A1L9TXV2_9EURO|nr:uncharacterized protein ASPSYDRAFT_299801 [Aspergillus sydowii CBS 593.65]OJJ64281.1 hypothetical protein ASPSYDRAFT_299801 [Aspergillus sydowii CBS 593.65]
MNPCWRMERVTTNHPLVCSQIRMISNSGRCIEFQTDGTIEPRPRNVSSPHLKAGTVDVTRFYNARSGSEFICHAFHEMTNRREETRPLSEVGLLLARHQAGLYPHFLISSSDRPLFRKDMARRHPD